MLKKTDLFKQIIKFFLQNMFFIILLISVLCFYLFGSEKHCKIIISMICWSVVSSAMYVLDGPRKLEKKIHI